MLKQVQHAVNTGNHTLNLFQGLLNRLKSEVTASAAKQSR